MPSLTFRHVLIFAPLLLVTSVFTLLIGRGLYQRDQILIDYRLAAREAMAEEDLKLARFYYSRLVGNGDRGTEQDQFNWFHVLAASGDQSAAQKQLDDLAPNDSTGYGPAHLLKAQSLLAVIDQEGLDRKKMLAQIEHHLQQGAWGESLENDLLWSQYLLASKQIDQAILRLNSAAKQNPELWFEIGQFLEAQGRPTDANRCFENAVQHAQKQLRADPINTTARLRLAAIFADRGERETVRKLLVDGIRLNDQDSELKLAASNFALMQLDQISDDQPGAEKQRLTLLTEAAELAPNNSSVYSAIQGFYFRARSDEQRRVYRSTLEEMITTGQNVAAAHFALGNLLFSEGEQESASFHLEAAVQMTPDTAIFANNLAWVLAHSEPADLDRAEKLASLALQSQPDNSEFMDTMAAVLVKQQRYREAIPLLESILTNADGEKRSELHLKLAEAYRGIGQTPLADRHQEQAASIPASGI
ncbi:MAG: tetratricopeptide repeat protein [Parasphingorhabdus sp.]|uniref:tetratricopeptide repeat protein n=1 Tax=Pseudomonadati TaxID=3379134 RepID=UPI0032662285